jgi:TetR/AcrR family transcriptional regulator of autoinduction and epiphytic fitness
MSDSKLRRSPSEKRAPEAKSPRRSKRFAGQDSDRSILHAAKKLFLQFGYDGVNLDKIAELAGVSRQTLYNRFKNKEAIFVRVIERHWSALDIKGFIFDEETGAGIAAEQFLRTIAENITLFVDEFEQVLFTRLVIAESRQMPWIAEEFYRLGKKPLMEGFTKGLSQLHARGLIVCPHPAIAAHQFLGLIQEFLIWPRVMAIGEGLRELPSNHIVIDEAIAMFLARYGKKA